MEAMTKNAFYIVEKNLKRTASFISSATERSFSHLREKAEIIVDHIRKETGCEEILEAVLTSDDAPRIYRESFFEESKESLFDEINRPKEPFFHRIADRFSKFYLCEAIAEHSTKKDLSWVAPFVCGDASPIPENREKTVAFLRNGQASRAFEQFARLLGGVSAVYENNFLNACESVYTGQATYAIIPIYSTADGRLSSFYRQIEKYELSIVFTCEIDSDDGENTTTFALVYKDPFYPETVGEPLYECKITFEDLNFISDITDAAAYFGVDIRAFEALPLALSGRTNAFAIVFGLRNANIGGFFTYLALEYPQTTAIGIYHKLA